MVNSLICAALLLSAGSDKAEGMVRVVGSSINVDITLSTSGGVLRLEGAAAQDLKAVGSFVVMVEGERKGEAFVVQGYRIVDMGGGKSPEVGQLLGSGGKYSLQSEAGGEIIPLKLPRRIEKRLADLVGSKVWVYGKRKKSELKVQRFGVLRLPPDAKASVREAADKLHAELEAAEGAEGGVYGGTVDNTAPGGQTPEAKPAE